MTILEFLEDTQPLPGRITAARTTDSTYTFFLLVRCYRQRTGRRPAFIAYTKGKAAAIKGRIEEHNLIDGPLFFVLTGFPRDYVLKLNPPQGTYVIAETEEGELTYEPHTYQTRRQLIKTLVRQLSSDLPARELLKLDWSGLKKFEEYEPYIRLAKIMNWTGEQLDAKLKEKEDAEPVGVLKRGTIQEVQAAFATGHGAYTAKLLNAVSAAVHWRALRSMGMDTDRTARELEIGKRRAKDTEEAARLLTDAEATSLAKRIIAYDQLQLRNQRLATELLVLNAPERVRR